MSNSMSRRTFLGVSAAGVSLLAAGESPGGARTLGGASRPVAPAKLLPTPEWLENAQTFCFDIHTPEEAVQRGVKILCGGTNASGPGYAGGPYVLSSDGKLVDMRTRAPIDVPAIRKKVAAAHARGLRVIGELMRMWDPQMLYVEHPEWQELKSPGAKPLGADHLKDPVPVTGCWNSPYGDHYIKQCVALTRELGWDGANLDGFGCWARCYCPACRAAYRAASGKEIPYKTGPNPDAHGNPVDVTEDLNDPEFRHYLKWRLGRFTQFVDRWQRAVTAANPDFASFFWSTGPGRWWHWSFAPLAECSDAANRVLNAPILELFWDFPPDQGSNLLPSFTVRYYRGLTGDRPVWMLPYFCTQGQQPMVAPPTECAFRVLTVLTNGSRAAQGAWQNNNGLPPDVYSTLITQREPWTTKAKTLKWAALFVSESSRLLYNVPGKRSELGGHWIGSGVDTPDRSTIPPGDRRLPVHMESAIGVFRAANEEHLPLDIVTEQDVENGTALQNYKVLILPNTACISQKGLDSIRAFVQNGGGLVALQESSLCDEFGTRRADFGLADLYKASFGAVEDHSASWPNYPNPTYVTLTPHPMFDEKVIRENYRYEGNTLDYIGMTVQVKAAPDAQVIATRADEPFVILSNPGKGRVAYIAADIGQSYFVAPYQYERKVIANAIRWAAGDAKPPVSVEAPMCVQTAFYEQENGKRTVVHLLNEINTTGVRALPEGNSSMREEVIPLSGIKVTFHDGAVTRVRQEPEGKDLDARRTDGGVEVTVPSLELHSMIVAER